MKTTELTLTSSLLSAFLAMLALTFVWPTQAKGAPPDHEVSAFAAFVKNATVADWLVPDFVVKFRIPQGARWKVSPVTDRAKATFAKSAAKARTFADETVITVVAGGRARRAGGYGRRNAWTYANELRVRYSSRIR